jgi:hypothetical protein
VAYLGINFGNYVSLCGFIVKMFRKEYSGLRNEVAKDCEDLYSGELRNLYFSLMRY